MNAITAAASGLQASMARLNVSASNVANMNSVGALPTGARAASAKASAYQPLVVRQAATAGGGVAITYGAKRPAYAPRHDFLSASADSRGMVAAPNVNPVDEAVEQMAAKQDFQANLTVIRTADQMRRSVIDLLA